MRIRLFLPVVALAILLIGCKVMDTRTGFIYAALEANEKRQLMSNAWESNESADRARHDAEKTVFKSLVGEFEKNWPRIVARAHQGS